MTIMFSLPMPPASNNLFAGTTRRYVSKPYAAWRALARPQMPKGRIDGPYTMRVCLDRPSRRAMDLDNRCKALSDMIVEAGLVSDDSLMDRLEMWWSKREPGKGAMAHVWLSPVAPPPWAPFVTVGDALANAMAEVAK